MWQTNHRYSTGLCSQPPPSCQAQFQTLSSIWSLLMILPSWALSIIEMRQSTEMVVNINKAQEHQVDYRKSQVHQVPWCAPQKWWLVLIPAQHLCSQSSPSTTALPAEAQEVSLPSQNPNQLLQVPHWEHPNWILEFLVWQLLNTRSKGLPESCESSRTHYWK